MLPLNNNPVMFLNTVFPEWKELLEELVLISVEEDDEDEDKEDKDEEEDEE